MAEARDPETGRLAERHAAVTRGTILRAARELFRERGYGATTAKALAERAGVAVQTIYSAFGSKAGVALALVELAIEESAIGELAQRLPAVRDPAEGIALIVGIRRRLRERAGETIAVMREGAAIEPSLRKAWEEGRRQRRGGQLLVMRRLEEQGALAEGLDAARAADISGALTADEVADVLLEQGGWSYDEYESWLIESLKRLLLR
ncbi:MAG TPA: helix-turn-helix domain-containing protein [Longimicrobiaceae bacterium]|nr:helix-turn-helix domain-containing protein [Longimicrobiaceae bacterium]